MKWSLYALLIGFGMDLILGDPHGFPHPVAAIGKLISGLEKRLRRLFPATVRGENIAGGVLWVLVAGLSTVVPAFVLWGCRLVSPWLRLVVESAMCWQILATKSLRVESMKVYTALETGDLQAYRNAVNRSQLHSFTAMVYGVDPIDVTEQQVHAFLRIFVFLPALCAAFASTILALCAVSTRRTFMDEDDLGAAVNPEAAPYMLDAIADALRSNPSVVRAATVPPTAAAVIPMNRPVSSQPQPTQSLPGQTNPNHGLAGPTLPAAGAGA